MKHFYTLLTLLLVSTISFAQGISVQGIARDNASSAITDTNLTFTFSIVEADNTVVFAETQGIKTDNFGVFSHIVSSGNPTTSTFDDVNFGTKNLKLKISVNYDGNDVEVYDQPFQYTPYAHYAANGVPTGSVISFLGTEAPKGWVLCNGQSLTSIDGTAALIALVGDNAPNLQGMFLRGTGTSPVNSKAGPALNATQSDDNKSHNHYVSVSGNTTSDGRHYHNIPADGGTTHSSGSRVRLESGYTKTVQTHYDGSNHSHSLSASGNSNYSGGTETRPVNYGVNYIIKL